MFRTLLQTLLHSSLSGQSFNAGDIGHFGFSFDGFYSLPELLFKRIRQTHHPVNDGEKVEYVLPVPALPVQRTHEVEFGPIAGLGVVLGLDGCADALR